MPTRILAVGLAAAVALVLSVGSGVASPTPISKVVATPGDPCTITGTTGNDVLVGTPSADVICGLDGRDTLKGMGGDDVLQGDDGRDVLIGGGGDDFLEGGNGEDVVSYAGKTADGVTVNLGDPTFDGGTAFGTDTPLDAIERLRGSMRADTLTSGGAAQTMIWGGNGDDVLVSGESDDHIFGQGGNDDINLVDGSGGDKADGGPGADVCNFDVGDTTVNCEAP